MGNYLLRILTLIASGMLSHSVCANASLLAPHLSFDQQHIFAFIEQEYIGKRKRGSTVQVSKKTQLTSFTATPSSVKKTKTGKAARANRFNSISVDVNAGKVAKGRSGKASRVKKGGIKAQPKQIVTSK